MHDIKLLSPGFVSASLFPTCMMRCFGAAATVAMTSSFCAIASLLDIRQEVVGWSTVSSSPSHVSWKTIPSSQSAQVVTTTLETTEWTSVPETTATGPIVSIFPVTSFSGTSIVQVKAATITLYPAQPTASLLDGSGQTSTLTVPHRTRDSVIAGGVVGGAMVIAGILAFFCIRVRNKRSHVHWRNRNLDGFHRQYCADNKGTLIIQPAACSNNDNDPFPSPLAPTFIREKRRPSNLFHLDAPWNLAGRQRRLQSLTGTSKDPAPQREAYENHELISRT
jgi:hypothetical protein